MERRDKEHQVLLVGGDELDLRVLQIDAGAQGQIDRTVQHRLPELRRIMFFQSNIDMRVALVEMGKDPCHRHSAPQRRDAHRGISNAIAEWLANVTTNPIVFMLIVNIALLVIGCFMESIAAILVFGPVLLTAATAMGIDPLYFGLVMVLNLMIGLCTPPFGVCLFVIADTAKISFQKMVKAMLPFYIPLFGCLILLCLVPEIGTWLPGLFAK